MTPVPVWSCRVEGGRLHLDQREAFQRYVQGQDGRHLELVLRPRRIQRSDRQNAYYWGVVVALVAEKCGYEPEEAHDALKARFLTDHEEAALPRVRSTTSLTVAEFQDYTERIRRWAAEYLDGLYIPEPGECEAA